MGFAKNWVRAEWQCCLGKIVESYVGYALMSISVRRLVGSGSQAIVLENLALRRQLAAYPKKPKRPQLTGFDRWFRAGISYLWKDWRSVFVFVQPETVLRRREQFRRFWAHLWNPNDRRLR